MKKRCFRATVTFILVLIFLCFSRDIHSEAASGSVTVSGASGEVGETVTVSVTIKASSAISGVNAVFTYDPSALQYVTGGDSGGAGSVVYFYDGIDSNKKKVSFSIKFKIKKEGAYSVECTSVDAVSGDMEQITMTKGHATIKGTVKPKDDPVEEEPKEDKPQEGKPKEDEPTSNKKSNNTRLSSLKIYPGTLSPEFSANVRAYTIQVDSDVDEVTISAATKSSKATFYVSGNTDLQEGENTVKVVVTAEDGTTNTYTITVNKGKVNQKLTVVNVDGVAYTINETIDADDIPDGFETTKIMYDKAAYNGAALPDGTMKLLNLKDEAGKEAFFVYDDNKKSFYPFAQIAISKTRTIILQPLDTSGEAPADMSATTLLLEGHQWDVWGDKSGEYYLVNARSSDGHIGLYRYDMVDGTYQRFTEMVITTEQTDVKAIDSILPGSIAAYYDYILIGAVGVIAVLIVVMIALAANADKRRRRQREKIDRWKERRRGE